MAVKSLRQRSILRKLFCATGSFIVSQRLPDANTLSEDTVGARSALVAEGIEQSAEQIERLNNFTPGRRRAPRRREHGRHRPRTTRRLYLLLLD